MTRAKKITLSVVLLVHGLLLGWAATRHSPVIDEGGHVPAGLSHWRLQRFDLYNVNPPLVRTVATAPLHLMSVPIGFTGYEVLPRNRAEFGMGSRWISSRPNSFLADFTIARWACIPFSLLGAVTCGLWAREMYGPNAGLMALCLWCFCPNVLGHASLITPDAGAAAVGVAACYVFRKWLQYRTMKWATAAGMLLGLTLLTKFTWLFLLGLWPSCWIVVRLGRRHSPSDEVRLAANVSDHESQFVTRRVTATLNRKWPDEFGHLSLIALLAFWVLNNGYLFEGSFQPLGKFQFFSQSLSGHEPSLYVGEGGNRFRGTLLEYLPVPVPRNFLQGIDHIKFEYEIGYPSYLLGEKRLGGWWYYYLYGMLVKMPVGTLVLVAVAAVHLLFQLRKRARIGIHAAILNVGSNDSGERLGVSPPCAAITRRADAQPLAGGLGSDLADTIYLLAPAIGIIWLVSSQTGFNHHLRYVLPAFPFLFIFRRFHQRLETSGLQQHRLGPGSDLRQRMGGATSRSKATSYSFHRLRHSGANGHRDSTTADDNSNIARRQIALLRFRSRLVHRGAHAPCRSPRSFPRTPATRTRRIHRLLHADLSRQARLNPIRSSMGISVRQACIPPKSQVGTSSFHFIMAARKARSVSGDGLNEPGRLP